MTILNQKVQIMQIRIYLEQQTETQKRKKAC